MISYRPRMIEIKENIKSSFWNNVEKTSTCWIWKASTRNGYGQAWTGKKQTYSHRISYQLLKGEIPEGVELDHLCKNRLCVNPDHLELVTHRENCIRGDGFAKKARQTHCIYGHPLSGENLWVSPTTGRRRCRTCDKKREESRIRVYQSPSKV